jgi:phenylacetate-CoA ligase
MKYSTILNSVLVPAYYNLRGRSYVQHRDFMERSQWWSAEQMRDFQWKELQRLLEYAFRSVPYYKKKYAGIKAEDIKTREDFAKLPPLSREEVNAHRDELCSAAFQSRLIPHATGGSSGVPTRFFITLESYDWRCGTTMRAYSWSGYRLGERTLSLWGAPVGKVKRIERAKLGAYRAIRRERFIATFLQTREVWQRTFDTVLRFKPRFIVGYVSSLEQFARFLLDRGRVLDGVEAILAGAEPVTDATRDLIMRAFRAPLFDTYGSREFMSVAAECEQHKGLHVHAENLLVETEFAGADGPSEFLVTDLHNYGMPFIRYRIGDMGTLSDSCCPCGRGLPMIQSIEGRALEILRTLDGRAISPILWRHILKDAPEVREYQIQQKTLDEIIISLVLSSPLSERSTKLVRQEMAKVFSPSTQVIIKPVDVIPRMPSGKRRVTISTA